jgi:long-chain fatty acid transport protein
MALAGLAGSAFATNGMFSHGYGMKSKGMAGASTASHDDAFAGANNPAAAVFSGDRIDLGADLFSPRREATMGGFFGPGGDATVESESEYFLIPEFGYNQMLGSDVAVGVSVYGQGGMNTDYPEVTGAGVNFFGGSGNLGVDLTQLIIAPTAALKFAPNHSVGVSALIGYERFAASGLPMAPTDDYDDAFGFGMRIGYMGKIGSAVTVGAAYATKVNFSELEDYNWLFLNGGDLDLAANWNIGVAWQVMPSLKLALDYQSIDYEGVDSIGAPVSTDPTVMGGFGWESIGVWKLGAEYKAGQNWTFRAGYSHTDSPIEGADLTACIGGSEACGEVTTNILAPGVIEDHVTLGFTYAFASGNELSMAYMHGFEQEVSGQGFFGEDTIKMYQDSIGVQYSWKM